MQVIEYGGAKMQNKSLLATPIEARWMRNFLEEWQWNIINGYNSIFHPQAVPGYWKWEVNNASLFRYLNPPMISEVHKNNMCAYFLRNLLLSSFAKLIQTVMFNRYHDVRPNTYFTNITSQITMPWNRPCCSYQLEICRKYVQICFRVSRKISAS